MTRLLQVLQRYRTPLTAIGGGMLGVAVMLLYLQLAPPGGRYSDRDIQRLADERIEKITPTPPREPELYAMLRPSVVLISREPIIGDTAPSGIGSGVVVDDSGVILTAYHVIAGKERVVVRFFDGRIATGTVIRSEPSRDMALLQVPSLPDGVRAATLAGGVQPGDPVMAIGSPFGLDGSFTAGVVSGLGRRGPIEGTNQTLENLIQFDAAVNPGNSGGPLIDYNGRVVGIVSNLVNPTGDRTFIGIGLAVPIESSGGILPPLG